MSSAATASPPVAHWLSRGSIPAASVTSVMSMRARPAPMKLRAGSRTKRRARSNAGWIKQTSFDCRHARARPAHPSSSQDISCLMDCRVKPGYDESMSRPPGEGDLVEHLGAEAFRRTCNRPAAKRLVEIHRGLVVGQGPNYHALQSALREVLARGGEQAATEAQPLEFRLQIKFVDFAVIEQAARTVAAVIG